MNSIRVDLAGLNHGFFKFVEEMIEQIQIFATEQLWGVTNLMPCIQLIPNFAQLATHNAPLSFFVDKCVTHAQQKGYVALRVPSDNKIVSGAGLEPIPSISWPAMLPIVPRNCYANDQ
jgi:hypothetical protein